MKIVNTTDSLLVTLINGEQVSLNKNEASPQFSIREFSHTRLGRLLNGNQVIFDNSTEKASLMAQGHRAVEFSGELVSTESPEDAEKLLKEEEDEKTKVEAELALKKAEEKALKDKKADKEVKKTDAPKEELKSDPK